MACGGQPVAAARLLACLSLSGFRHLYWPCLVAEEAQHLVYLIHAQRLLALLQLAYEAQAHARLVGEVNLRQAELLAHLLDECR